jgi:hypothetical protein|nr:MAG TPA: hypothetical protein [Caudoviricetes sp.]
MFECPKGKREFNVFVPEEDKSIDDLSITDRTEEHDVIYAKNLNEAKMKAFEEYGECVVQWRRKTGWKGGYDYAVTKEIYEDLKNKK